MKISLWIPKEKNIHQVWSFLQNEVKESENIKSKETQKSVQQSLRKMIKNAQSGYCIYTEDDYVEKKLYNGDSFFYRCGKEFFRPEKQNTFT